MGQRDRFEHAVAALQEAAFDDTRWPEAALRLDQACGSQGHCLAIGDENASGDMQVTLARLYYRGQWRADLERRYFGRFHAIDERIPRLRLLPHGKLVTTRSLYTEHERKHSVVYREELPRGRGQNGLNTRLHLPDGAGVTWQTADPVGGSGWASDRVAAVKRLMPHVAHFARVRRALVEAQAVGLSQQALLENSRIGIVQLDRRGRIVAANDAALTVLRARAGLCDQDGFLRATDPDDDTRLNDLIAGVLPGLGDLPAGASMNLTRSALDSPLVVHLSAVANPASDVRPGGIAAMVLFLDRSIRPRIDAVAVARVLGLSPTEGEVAARLAEGLTPRRIAEVTGRTEGTVRWHLHRIYLKLGIKGQAELAGLVAACSGIPGETVKP